MTPENQLVADWTTLSQQRAPVPASLGRHALSWITSAYLLAHDADSAAYLRQIMDILQRNPDWHFYAGVPKPSPCLEKMLPRNLDKMAYVAQELSYREQIREAMMTRFGSDTVSLRLGDRQQALGIRLSTEITDGGLSFSLIDTNKEFELGYVAIDYLNSDMLIVTSIQEHGEIFPTLDDTVRSRRAANKRTDDGHKIANDQHAIRRWVAKNSGSHGFILDNGTKTHNPGVEEALMLGVIKVLQEVGFANEKTIIFVPHPDISHWGRYSYRGGNLGVAFAAWKQMQSALDKDIHLKQQVQEIIDAESSYLTDEDRNFIREKPYYMAHLLYKVVRRIIQDGSPLPIVVTDAGETNICQFYIDTLISSLGTENQEKARRVVQMYGRRYESPSGRLLLDVVLHIIAQLTPAYQRQFHAYNSVFSNVVSQAEDENGRYLTVGSILNRQYAQRITVGTF